MDHLPALLAAMYRAPMCSTLHGTIRHWSDPEASQRVFQSQGRLTAVLSTGPLQPREWFTEIWLDGGRMREQYGEALTVVTDDTVLRYAPSIGAVQEARQPMERFDHTTWIWTPRTLIGQIDLDDEILEVERLGRPAWRATGSHASQGIPMPGIGIVVAGERYELDVDQATGVVLRLAGALRSGEPVGEVEWTSFLSDAPIDPAIFDSPFPPGVRVQSHNEMLLAVAKDRGIDMTGIDPDDDAQIRAALSRGGPPRPPLEHHVASGAPPADEPAARDAITHAFVSVGERDGDDLIHVQAGAGLAPYLDRATERFHAHFEVRAIKFLHATEAAVAYDAVDADGRTILSRGDGRALLLDGTWQIERKEFTSLLAFAGVHCPAPPEAGPSTSS